jgi:uncharacterized protein YerC
LDNWSFQFVIDSFSNLCDIFGVANTKNHAYLSDQQVLNFTIGLCETLSQESAAQEIADILLKLLTPQELRMLVVRLQIQKMLLEFSTYSEIKDELHVSSGTISRVKLLLEQTGNRTSRPATDLGGLQDAAYVNHGRYRNLNTTHMNGPLGKYSYGAWPVEMLGLIIKAIFEKQEPP